MFDHCGKKENFEVGGTANYILGQKSGPAMAKPSMTALSRFIELKNGKRNVSRTRTAIIKG